jgi:hypothetical protein
MKAQYINKLMSSMLAFVDHKVLIKGEAYENHGSNFYKTDTQLFSPTYETWAAPFKQMVCDQSIIGATRFTGVSIDGGSEVGIGTSGISFLQHHQGQIFFDNTTNVTTSHTISGNYSVKDFNTYLTSEAEEELLFNTKFELRPKVNQTVTGLSPETQTYPAIFLKDNGGRNNPFAFGGLDLTNVTVRAIVLADSAFRLDAVCSIMRDLCYSTVPLLDPEDLPYNALGGCTGEYNYTGLQAANLSTNFFIDEVFVSKRIENSSEYKKINKSVYSALVDFEISDIRTPRL